MIDDGSSSKTTGEGLRVPIKLRQCFPETANKGFTFWLDVVNQGKCERNLKSFRA